MHNTMHLANLHVKAASGMAKAGFIAEIAARLDEMQDLRGPASFESCEMDFGYS